MGQMYHNCLMLAFWTTNVFEALLEFYQCFLLLRCKECGDEAKDISHPQYVIPCPLQVPPTPGKLKISDQ